MAHRRSFIDFVEGLLNLDPIKRWSPQQAAKHPFITGEKFTGPFQASTPSVCYRAETDAQPPTVPSKKSLPSSAAPSPATPSSSKKYGGLVQTPPANRNQRVYSDAGTYNTQPAQQQPYPSHQQPSQSINNSRPPTFQPAYDPPPSAGHRARMPSQGQWQPMGPPQGSYQPRIPSQSLVSSTSHGALRQNPPTAINTNPPPNSYYPASRNRSNTINQMDVIPPALARLTHMSMPDPSGHRNLTPVLNRGDDPYREWERRQQGGGAGGGHSKKSSIHHASYPQLEYLQEQAELAAMGGSWMMPGQYTNPQIGGGHRSRPSTTAAGVGGYQMQPHISGASGAPTSPATSGYHHRQASEYELPPPNTSPSSSGRASYLPAFPPPAATTSGQPQPFDPFDTPSAGMMYTPIQSSPYSLPGPGGYAQHQQQQQQSHGTRASFSGPYGQQYMMGTHSHQPQQQGQGGQQSPRNQRRRQQYNV